MGDSGSVSLTKTSLCFLPVAPNLAFQNSRILKDLQAVELKQTYEQTLECYNTTIKKSFKLK